MESKAVPKEVLVDFQEKYMKVRKLLDEYSKQDPESEPYKSKYSAMEILKEMRTKIVHILDKNLTKEQEHTITTMLAILWLNLGIVSVDTEDLASGEEQLTNCIDLLNEWELQPECILPILSALNQLGILWSQRDQPTKSKVFLERAEGIYKDYIAQKNFHHPINMAKLFNATEEEEPDAMEILEKLHTLTLYYLAQIYGALKDHLKSAVYCHMTLRRQLNDKDLDQVEWALNAATLSQFFMEKGGFCQARYHLAAASYILSKYEEQLKSLQEEFPNDDNMAAKWENFRHRNADVSRCWAKYGILLLSASRERLMQQSENYDNRPYKTTPSVELDPQSEITAKCLESLKFISIEKEITFLANQVTDKYLLDFNDARAVFLNSQKWLEKAKTYYNLESHASDYVQIEQDASQAYRYLSFFEEDENRQAKMHKRRIVILENVLSELNHRYYQAVCRQIWMELGETYSDILDIKLDRFHTSKESPTPHALSKINNLAKNAIKNFQEFLNSIQDAGVPDGITKKYSDDMIRPALCTYFHLGRLYNKIVTPDKSLQLENVKNSLNAYKFLVEYCEKDKKANEAMQVELSVCKELVNLLPLRIQKLTQEVTH
ncbi:KIF1-binding protein homolog [Cephus cinctus]|uniref:KIF-binding protein n=1 Tax=Cephus cinctus TaxID=211228 RepID=A0AAJ7BGR3_CEPCN|nr:KIF1-binding protein homolog [Cephus cinctus]